jgi:hypothetical protein
MCVSGKQTNAWKRETQEMHPMPASLTWQKRTNETITIAVKTIT